MDNRFINKLQVLASLIAILVISSLMVTPNVNAFSGKENESRVAQVRNIPISILVHTDEGTADTLVLELIGSNTSGEVLTLAGGFPAGGDRVFRFMLTDAHFCQFWGYRVAHIPTRKFDSWSGSIRIQIDGTLATQANVSILTNPTWTRMGWWSGTATFNSICGNPATSTYPNLHRIDFQITTGSDGISTQPFINLGGAFSGRIFVHIPAVAGNFPPKSTQTVSYYVPLDFCQMTELAIHSFTESWQIERLVLQIDGVTVADVHGPINVDSGTTYSHNWSGSATYVSLCGS